MSNSPSNVFDAQDYTFKQYYYPVSDAEDSLTCVPDEPAKRKLNSHSNIDAFFDQPKIKRKKNVSSTVGKGCKGGGISYISTNKDDGANSENKLCKTCNVWVRQRYFSNHLKSNIHKNKVIEHNSHKLSNVSLINSAFGCRIRTYRIGSDNQQTEFETPEIFFDSINNKIQSLIKECLDELTIININFIVHAEFVQETKDIQNVFDFQSFNYNFCIGDDYEPLIKKVKENLCTHMSEFEKKDSGWSLKKILFVDMNVNKFNPLRGSSF